MFDHLWLILPGILVGCVAGFMPGIGIFTSMMMLIPLLYELTAVELLTFYIALASTTQYVGSITATVFGLPGEASSLPAVKEGNQLYKNGLGSFAISGAALGSFFGSVLVVLIVSIFVSYLDNIYKIYNTKTLAFILLGVSFLICFTSENKIIAVILSVLGYLLGRVGCRHIDDSCFATFGNADLTTGLPLISVICALYVFPQLLKKYNLKNKNIALEDAFLKKHLKKYFSNMGSSIRGTIIGFFTGFTPGISTAVSSNLAYQIEKWIQLRRKKYQPGNYPSLVSAETANNAGAFSCLLPLIVFGIPLVPSEALLYELIMTKGTILGQNFTADFYFSNLVLVLLITNLVALFVAWPMAKYICYLQKIPPLYFKIFVFALLLWSIYEHGQSSFQELYNLTVFFFLLPIGYLLRKIDMLPLVFVFIIQSRLDVVLISLKGLL
jgi:putative tricarboxylic transport membrane protein